MGEKRGRKAKKAKWQWQLGIKELIFTGLGVVGLAMLSFTLGTLAGRGDIYRVLHNWGLLSSDRGDAAQIWRQAGPLPAAPVAPSASHPAPETPAAQTSTASPPPPSPPVAGDIAALPKKPPQAETKKSGKPAVKAKEDDLERIRREVASKLKFQNSLDPAATRKTPPGGESQKSSAKEPPAASRASTSLVVVAKFRNANRAQLKLSQMRQQGDKVVLREGKDAEGRYFAIYRQITVSPSKSRHVEQTRLKKTKPEN
jgi:hypothetical protein